MKLNTTSLDSNTFFNQFKHIFQSKLNGKMQNILKLNYQKTFITTWITFSLNVSNMNFHHMQASEAMVEVMCFFFEKYCKEWTHKISLYRQKAQKDGNKNTVSFNLQYSFISKI